MTSRSAAVKSCYLNYIFRVASFDWEIPGNTISVSGNSIVLDLTELKTGEASYKKGC